MNIFLNSIHFRAQKKREADGITAPGLSRVGFQTRTTRLPDESRPSGKHRRKCRNQGKGSDQCDEHRLLQ